MITLKNRMELL